MPVIGRRRFLQGSLAAASLGVLPGCELRAPEARSPARAPRIGLLGTTTGPGVEGLKQGLIDLGYGIGAVNFEGRTSDREDQLPANAAELVQQGVDVIIAFTPAGAWSARQATASIPIVAIDAGNPVGNGLVTSLARPDANVTGLATHSRDLSGKRLQLLLETVPTIARPAILWNPGSKDSTLSYEETKEAAQALGSQAQSLEVRAPPDFARARQAALDTGADGLIVLTDSLVRTHYSVVTGLASNARLPAMYDQPLLYMNFGGLMAYGPSFEDLARRAATYVDQNPQGRESRRSPHRAATAPRLRHQPQGRREARAYHPTVRARAGDAGHLIGGPSAGTCSCRCRCSAWGVGRHRRGSTSGECSSRRRQARSAMLPERGASSGAARGLLTGKGTVHVTQSGSTSDGSNGAGKRVDLKIVSRELTEGASRAPARSYLHAVGITNEDLDTKPLIGIASTWNEFSPCQANLKQVADHVKQGIRAGRRRPDRVHHDLRHRRHRDGHRGDEGVADQPRHHRRLDRACDVRPPPGRPGDAGRLRQDPARLPDGDCPPEPPLGVHLRRQHPARHLQGQEGHHPGRLRGGRRLLEGRHELRRGPRHRERREPRRRCLRRPLHGQHDVLLDRGDGHDAAGRLDAAGRGRPQDAGGVRGRQARPSS